MLFFVCTLAKGEKEDKSFCERKKSCLCVSFLSKVIKHRKWGEQKVVAKNIQDWKPADIFPFRVHLASHLVCLPTKSGFANPPYFTDNRGSDSMKGLNFLVHTWSDDRYVNINQSQDVIFDKSKYQKERFCIEIDSYQQSKKNKIKKFSFFVVFHFPLFFCLFFSLIWFHSTQLYNFLVWKKKKKKERNLEYSIFYNIFLWTGKMSERGPVIIGVDGSDLSKEAINWAKENFVRHGDKITLVHVQPQAINIVLGSATGGTNILFFCICICFKC